jgi:hypothetical protein
MEDKELFEDYEMRSWEFTPRIYKILGIAVLTNFLFIFAFGQFNLLTTRGCDTPYAGIVCQVLDSAYVASTFLGKDTEWESRPYEKTELEDADITYIDVSDKLEYPEGYFALANPEPPMTEDSFLNNDIAGMNPTMNPPGFPISPNSSGNSLITNPAVTPTPNKSIENQEDVGSPFVIDTKPAPRVNTPRIKPTPRPARNNSILSNESPKTLGGNKTVAKANPTPTPQPTPEQTPTAEDAQKAKEGFKINREPFQKLADGVIAKISSDKPEEKIDLKQSFIVTLDGTLTPEGKFDAKKTRFIKGEGDEQMVNVAKSAIEAIGDSTILSYLQALGVDKVNITLVQDDKQITAVIKSNQPSEEKARTVSSGFNGFITLANMNTKDDKEVQALLKAVKVKAEGKSFVINFAMPKDDAHKMIDQKLQEARLKKSQTNNGEGEKEANAKSK